MQLKPMRIGRVKLYTSGLDAEERRITAWRSSAISTPPWPRHPAPSDPHVAVIPEGPYVVPVHEPA